MALNIYTKPVTKTDETVQTTVYTQEIQVESADYQTVSFPQCLATFSEDERKEIVSQLMIRSLQQSE